MLLFLGAPIENPRAVIPSSNDYVMENDSLDRKYTSLPSAISDEPMQEIKNWSLPCITRFIETDWGDEERSQNMTTDVTIPSWATMLPENESPTHQDLNSTVDNNSEYVIQETSPPEIQIESEPLQSDSLMTPMTFAKRGHYFPFAGYSKMYFDFEADSLWGAQYRIHLEIERGADTYARTLTVSLDGSQFYSCVIGANGFHNDIWTPTIWWGDTHTP